MMSTIPKQLIDEIRQKTDIVEIIGEYVQLKRQGRNYFGLCPFHNEKSPSFSVTEEKQIFHCFGCGKGGNVYTFLMEKEAFSFMDAVTYLADRSGIELPKITNKETAYSEEANTILHASDWLTQYYHHVLKYTEEGKAAITYLHERGITDETIDSLSLGFAPSDSEVTVDFLLSKDFHQQQLIKTNVLSMTEAGKPLDPFRGRVIFPIKNHLGRAVAFGGRALGEQKPKYLNSPENELFHKRTMLYHFHLAKNFIRKQSQVIIFEGYMDVIAAHQANIKNVVATLGTSLSEQQAKLLKRYANEIILCYDTDDAGLKGMYDAAQLFRSMQCEVKIAMIPKGADPDDYIRENSGEAFLKNIIQSSHTYFKFFMYYHSRGVALHVDSEKISLIETFTKELANVEQPIEREIYANDIAKQFDVSVQTILQNIEKYKKTNQISNKKDNDEWNSNTIDIYQTSPYDTNHLRAYEKAERTLLALMIQQPRILEHVQSVIGVKFNVQIHQVIATHLYGHYEQYGVIDIGEFIDYLSHPEERQLVTKLTMMELNESISDEEIADYIYAVERESGDEQKIRLLKQELKTIEQANDPIRAAEIGMEIIRLEKQLKLRSL